MAQMAASACQWLGVAMDTASTAGSANIWRMSSNSLALSPPFFCQVALRHFARGLIDVAEAGHAGFWNVLGIVVEVIGAAAAQADDADVDFVVGAPDAGRGHRRGGAEEKPAGSGL